MHLFCIFTFHVYTLHPFFPCFPSYYISFHNFNSITIVATVQPHQRLSPEPNHRSCWVWNADQLPCQLAVSGPGCSPLGCDCLPPRPVPADGPQPRMEVQRSLSAYFHKRWSPFFNASIHVLVWPLFFASSRRLVFLLPFRN